jgi:PKHD-type hydroxylase
MMMPLPLPRRDIQYHSYWNLAFDADECNMIVNEYKNKEYQDATVLGDNPDGHKRNNRVQWLDMENNVWIYERFAQIAADLNHQFFGFDIRGLEENIQFSQYSVGEHYAAWHEDRQHPGQNDFPARKLSLSLQLSDPMDYVGGDLEMWLGGETSEKMPNTQGTMISFDSRNMHRVTPVVEGTRYSLVSWVAGPPFR